MLKKNSELRAEAREVLRGKWPMAALATLIVIGVSGASVYLPPLLGLFLIGLPVMYGFFVLMLGLRRGASDIDFGVLFEAFKSGTYQRIAITKLLQVIYVWLWSLLLLIPGIIKQYSYAMTDYILKDEPSLSGNAAIEKSMAMMAGHKMKLFLLDLSFIGWYILACFTLGIGIFFLTPYMLTARAAFYEDLKAQ